MPEFTNHSQQPEEELRLPTPNEREIKHFVLLCRARFGVRPSEAAARRTATALVRLVYLRDRAVRLRRDAAHSTIPKLS